jgi:hypothetical protein
VPSSEYHKGRLKSRGGTKYAAQKRYHRFIQPSPALVMLIALNLFIEKDETPPKETIQPPEQGHIPF